MSISPSPGTSNWSSQTSNHNILGQLKEELVVKDTIKTEMESPQRESELIKVKIEQEPLSWSSNTFNTLGHIKKDNCEDDAHANKPSHGILERHIKQEPKCSKLSNNDDDMFGENNEEICYDVPITNAFEYGCYIKPEPGSSVSNSNTLGQLKEEQVVKESIKVEMKLRQDKEEKGFNAPVTIPLDGILEQYLKSLPGCSTRMSDKSLIVEQLEDELVVEGTIKAEMESPHRESDQESNDTLYTDIDVTYSDVKEAACVTNIQYINEESAYSSIVLSQNSRNRKDSGDKSFMCSICNKCFSFKSYLTQHMVIHSEEKPFECSICNKRFKLKSTLRTHTIVHEEDKQFSCLQCSKSFKHKSGFQTHMLLHSGKQQFSCSKCSKSFGYKFNLKTHMFTHSDVQRFPCPKCRRSFSFISGLNRHLLTHSAERLFSCTVCSNSFKLKSCLKVHMLIHAVRQFSCEICNKSFINKSKLAQHIFTHTGNKPFSCPSCSKSFIIKSRLTRHILTHSKHKRFSCLICSKSFSKKSDLKKHMRVHS